jgi:hypothetical protein
LTLILFDIAAFLSMMWRERVIFLTIIPEIDMDRANEKKIICFHAYIWYFISETTLLSRNAFQSATYTAVNFSNPFSKIGIVDNEEQQCNLFRRADP